MDNTFRSTARFFIPIGGDIMWWMIISVSVILNYLNICGFNNRIDAALAQLIYVLISFPICFICVFLSKLVGIDEYLGTQPNIKIVEVSPYEGYVIFPDNSSSHTAAGTSLFPTPQTRDTQKTWQEEKNCFAHVVFENKKRKWSFATKTAEQVTAHVRFLNEKKEDLLNYDFIGRWGNYMQQPKDVFTVLGSPEYTSIYMKSDGTKYSLDLAMKNTQGLFMTAFNNQNYSGKFLLRRENILNDNNVIVEVTLNADNMDEKPVYYFAMSHKGIGSSLDIIQIEKPL